MLCIEVTIADQDFEVSINAVWSLIIKITIYELEKLIVAHIVFDDHAVYFWHNDNNQ